jgi:hypothetical protein
MRGLLAQDVLDVWDAGRARSALDRARLLLGAGDPGHGHDDVRALTVGDRDRLLLELRERTFGGDLRGFVECPGCRAPLELTLQTAALCAVPPGERAAEIGWDRGTARLRAPTVGDLEDAVHAGPAGAYRTLFSACIEARGPEGEALAVADLSDDVRDLLAERLAELDPAAEVLLSLVCPSCAQSFRHCFDVAAFLWSEITAYATRVLREVDALAGAYGWPEEKILAMTAARRRAYLELVSERTVRS